MCSSWSWAIFTERMRACLSIFWGVIGINLAFSILSNLVQESLAAGVRDPIVFKVLYILTLFASIVVQGWLGIGMTMALLKIARDEP